MDHWRGGETPAGWTTYLIAHYKSLAMRHLQFAKSESIEIESIEKALYKSLANLQRVNQ